MVRKWLIGTIAPLFLISAVSATPPSRYGLGLMLPDPTGLSAKAWLLGSTAVAGGLGWSAEKNHYLHLHADLLWTALHLEPGRELALDFYLGAGSKIIFRDHDKAWLRIPLGMEFLSSRSPFNIFFEVVPSYNFSKFRLLGAVGFRTIFTR